MLRAFADGTLFGRRTGTSTANVLCLHGWARTHEDFLPAIGEHQAIAIDLPGFGATPAPPRAWGPAEYAEAIAPVLVEMADEVVVVGHSNGGRVALWLAKRYPLKVRALVLCGVPLLRPAGEKGRTPLGYQVVRRLHRLHVIGPARLERARERYGSFDYRNATGVMREVLVRAVNEDLEKVMVSLDQRVQLLWGANDTVVPLEVAKRSLGLFRRGELEVVPGCGHLLPTGAPESLEAAISRAEKALGP